jgi:hypothetical protein
MSKKLVLLKDVCLSLRELADQVERIVDNGEK